MSSTYNHRGLIGFHDEIFVLDREWLFRFLPLYRKKVSLPFWANARFDTLDEEIIRALRESGCARLHCGVESGNEKIRNQVLGKNISNQEIEEKAHLVRASGIKLVTTFMLGIPAEKEEDIRESIDFCRRLRPGWILVSLFSPYPGTALYEEMKKEGVIPPHFYAGKETPSFYSPRLSFSHPHLSPEKLAFYWNNFPQLAGAPYS